MTWNKDSCKANIIYFSKVVTVKCTAKQINSGKQLLSDAFKANYSGRLHWLNAFTANYSGRL
jgi:hypothetical protein